MFSAATYTQRRHALSERIGQGLALFWGHVESPMNYPHNAYPFRQDSSFLYFFGISQPGLVGLIDFNTGESLVFGQEASLADAIWSGTTPSLQDQASSVGASYAGPLEALIKRLQEAQNTNRLIHFLPPYRAETQQALNRALSLPLDRLSSLASSSLIRAVIDLRAIKTDEEIADIEDALSVTHDMHTAAMYALKEARFESDLVAAAQAQAAKHNRLLAYPMILTTQGQILHNHRHDLRLDPADMVLGDFGAEGPRHYASDITRCFPVSGRFSTRQRDIYELVLTAQEKAIESLRPGVPYKDIHLQTCKDLVDGLKSLNLMTGATEDAVHHGAHALFFPHGLGHMLGLDVHDMEDLGEDHVGYTQDTLRSDQFGLAYLRLGRSLEEGFVLTVEPGIYFIPELFEQWRAQKRCSEFINYGEVEKFLDFGGVRIEDNCLITRDGARVLGHPIPKTVSDIESLLSS